ncbi:MAG: 2-C-methyl-D-erythritol 4-phosphate cytidylyltransferase, partial [Pseudomonadales bacterium]|nr:2-C-methyl-D-erythritol 4-phosphate cytidylyltransferase [Pseudomonadales bacterium]
MSVEKSLHGSPVWAIVPAAGSGSRFGSDTPKQYLPLCGVPVLTRTLSALARPGLITCAVVALAPQDEHFSTLSLPPDLTVEQIEGGQSRLASVFAGMQHLAGRASREDWVLVHDAARPLLSEKALQRLFDALAHSANGGLLALPANDTVKLAAPIVAQPGTLKTDAAGNNVVVQSTLDRSRVWMAQTPQLFRYGLLYDALEKAMTEPNTVVTDEASAMEQA